MQEESQAETGFVINGELDVLRAVEHARENGSVLVVGDGEEEVENMLRKQGWINAASYMVAKGLYRVYAGDPADRRP